jgi:hypothetical protein
VTGAIDIGALQIAADRTILDSGLWIDECALTRPESSSLRRRRFGYLERLSIARTLSPSADRLMIEFGSSPMHQCRAGSHTANMRCSRASRGLNKSHPGCAVSVLSMTAEKRAYPRRPANTSARIMIPLSCTLVDVSNGGAKLQVQGSRSLPNEFLLELRVGVSRWCRVLRRDGDQVAVQFINPPAR